MRLKRRLARIGSRLERWADRLRARLRRKRRDSLPVIDPYMGYSTPEELILRGRVLSAVRRHEPQPDQGRFTNLRQMLSLFLTDEVAGVTVTALDTGQTAVTDEEGYFTLHLPRDGTGPTAVTVGLSVPEAQEPFFGWEDAEQVTEAASLDVQVTSPRAELGVISDIDDTLLRTGSYSILRNLWTSLTGNTLTREIFADAITLMERLSDGGRNPVFYVSSSPWNLHDFLNRIFARAGLVRGPMFLRDLGVSETKFVTGTHADHKTGAIEAVLAANPDLPFVLVGDTGQHDAEVYAGVAARDPGRIARVILRAPGRGADKRDLAHVAALRAQGVPVTVGADYAEVLDVLGPVAGDGAAGPVRLEERACRRS